MEETLKAIVLEALPNVVEAKRQEVVTALITQGIMEPEDLQFVNSCDLENILPPIQVRKAVAFFKAQYDSQKVQASPVSNHSVHSTPTSIPATVSCASSVVNPSPTCSYDWVSSFAIPWDQCCPNFIQTIDLGKPPKEAQLRELVAHMMSDVSS